MSSPSILPDDHAQFTSKDYWDKFFTQRGQFAFEWYGDFKEVYPVLSRSLSKTDRILVIGCGNSNFSSDLYDKGYHSITNLDFSELVIEEMKSKNAARSDMTWIVGDMTTLENFFALNSFDVVIDKGALDALMSVNSEELKLKAINMFDGISNVLTATGRYYLITLAEDYILANVSSYFMKTCNVPEDSDRNEYIWQINITQIVTSKPSPFVPLLMTMIKSNTPNHGKAIMSISTANVKRKTKQGRVDESSQISFDELPSVVKGFQEFNQLSYRVRKLDIGRFETVPLWSSENIEVPRFTLYILDANEQAQLSCAVFFIPFGREADYQFTTQDGLLDIAFQAACKRLIVVACNRPHIFGEMSQLQDELSPFIMSIKLADMDPSEKIPYMAVAQDKSWEEIEQGKSSLSGIYVVEEQIDEDDEDAVYRRLIFLQNQQFIQTEVHLVPPLSAKKSTKKKGKGKAKSGTKSSSSVVGEAEKPTLVFDHKYLDDHHKGIIASLSLNPNLVLNASQRNGNNSATCSAVLIGLGGGALSMGLQKYLPALQMTACDIDETVYEIAKKLFGFEANRNTQVVIQDGAALLNQIWEQSRCDETLLKDLIVVDVDSKDPSLGLSAPPREFITFEMLEHMHQILRPGGVLVFNVVARSKTMLADFIGRVKIAFNAQASNVLNPSSLDHLRGRVLEMKPADENVNICLVCLKAGWRQQPNPVISSGKNSKRSAVPSVEESIQWSKTLSSWLSVSVIFFFFY